MGGRKEGGGEEGGGEEGEGTYVHIICDCTLSNNPCTDTHTHTRTRTRTRTHACMHVHTKASRMCMTVYVCRHIRCTYVCTCVCVRIPPCMCASIWCWSLRSPGWKKASALELTTSAGS